jgi:hypothetical protein
LKNALAKPLKAAFSYSEPMMFVRELQPELDEAMERYLELWVYR